MLSISHRTQKGTVLISKRKIEDDPVVSMGPTLETAASILLLSCLSILSFCCKWETRDLWSTSLMYTLPQFGAVVLAPNPTSSFHEPARRASLFLSVRSAPRAPPVPHLHRRSPLRQQRVRADNQSSEKARRGDAAQDQRLLQAAGNGPRSEQVLLLLLCPLRID